MPVFDDSTVIEKNLLRYSFTTGEPYDERAAISGLLHKLVTSGGRYSKYHPNMMLSLYDSSDDAAALDPSSESTNDGVEESKHDPDPSVSDLAPVTASEALLRTGVVTEQELSDYQSKFKNRLPFSADIPKAGDNYLAQADFEARLQRAIDASKSETDMSRLGGVSFVD